MASTIKIAGERGNLVSIEVPGKDGVMEAGLMVCLVRFDIAPFHGCFEMEALLGELLDFAEELAQLTTLNLNRDVAGLSNFGECISISIVLMPLGKIRVRGYLHPEPGGTRLTFDFESDLTFMDKLSRELAQLAKEHRG